MRLALNRLARDSRGLYLYSLRELVAGPALVRGQPAASLLLEPFLTSFCASSSRNQLSGVPPSLLRGGGWKLCDRTQGHYK